MTALQINPQLKVQPWKQLFGKHVYAEHKEHPA